MISYFPMFLNISGSWLLSFDMSVAPNKIWNTLLNTKSSHSLTRPDDKRTGTNYVPKTMLFFKLVSFSFVCQRHYKMSVGMTE